ncbi:MAG: CAP domain-containing protein [Limnochordia bacterium]
MIAKRSGCLVLALVVLMGAATLGEAASFNFGYSTFDTGSGSESGWNLNWSWFSPGLTPKPVQPEPKPDPVKPPVQKGDLTSEESLAVAKVNAERKARGIHELKVNDTLVRLARLKAKDMAEKGYFSHISPTYGSPAEMMEAAGLRFKWWGENIARVSSVTVAHEAYMESPDHRANILSAGYTEIGVGVYKKGNRVYQSQLFMKPR